jgi:succinylglutamic semialdehyde dehydrogenase
MQRHSPVDNSLTWSGSWATPLEIEAAADRSHRAFPTWSRTSLEHRCSIAKKFAELLHSHRAAIAKTITLESGKPLWESDLEVQSAISKVSNAIEAIQTRRWTTVEGPATSPSVIRFHPLGCMVVLGPYNLPLHLPGAHIVPALLAGNTVLFKPSEKSPAVGDWIANAWHSAGLPEGVLKTIHGAADQAKHAVSLSTTSGVLFTGSYAAGVQLHQQLAGRPECLLALEMGGNNPLVVHQCSHRKAVIANIIQSAYLTSGQRCTCARRLIIVDTPTNVGLLHDLSIAIEKIRTANPLATPQPFLGSLVSSQVTANILAAQQAYRSMGAEVLNEARLIDGHAAILTPSLIHAGPQAIASIQALDQEHFGPMLVASIAKDLDEAIELSNRTRYGLAAGLMSDDPAAFDQFVSHVRAGIINWNSPTTGASGRLPFGGVGSSGNHRPSGYYAADYCSYPVASIENHQLAMPKQLPPGLDGIDS